MTFHIITIFPDIFSSYVNESILARAQEKKLITIHTHDLRRFSIDKHNTVDDRPYGGGAGMVLMAQPIISALAEIKSQTTTNKKFQKSNSKTILLSAKGKTWTQQMARRYAKLDNVVLICGRYEGVDERVKKFVDEEISIGDFVLTGGELPAMVIVDSVTRLLPGVLGNAESALSESHNTPHTLEHPHYTRPEVLEVSGLPTPNGSGKTSKKLRVPKVLLSGNHADIEAWRQKKSKLQAPSNKQITKLKL